MDEVLFGDGPKEEMLEEDIRKEEMPMEEGETFEIELDIRIGGSDPTVYEEEKTDTIYEGKEERSTILETSEIQLWLTELEVGKMIEKKYLSSGEKIQISLLGEDGVGILAVRVNGEVCRWHWESGNIVPEYEKGGEVLTEIVFVHEIKKWYNGNTF